MPKVKLIVEGDADVKFLKDLIHHHFDVDLNNNTDFITSMGDHTSLHRISKTIKSSTTEGNLNLLLFDCDNYTKEEKLELLNNEKQNLGIDIESFLFPDNKSKGNLETLLKNIINKDNKKLFNCIDDYSDCVTNLNIDQIRNFDEKSKIFVYVDSFIVGGRGKEKQRDYKEKTLWDLESDSLKPLLTFLRPYYNNA